jgi:hypothetical protein
MILDINYAASTVRDHAVNDDGEPFTLNGGTSSDTTNSATVTDKSISWSENWNAGTNHYTLDRITGKLTFMYYGDNGQYPAYQCQVWTPPNYKPKF